LFFLIYFQIYKKVLKLKIIYFQDQREGGDEEQQLFDPEAQAITAEDRRLEENLEIEKFLNYPDLVDYNSFKNLAFNLIGDKKEYESGIELASAYKILKSIIKKPLDIFIDGKKEPHYMKPTISIKRYKFEGTKIILILVVS
jgi:hypothetical protein